MANDHLGLTVGDVCTYLMGGREYRGVIISFVNDKAVVQEESKTSRFRIPLMALMRTGEHVDLPADEPHVVPTPRASRKRAPKAVDTVPDNGTLAESEA